MVSEVYWKVTPPPGHKWTEWELSKDDNRWYRHCTIAGGNCTAKESKSRE